MASSSPPDSSTGSPTPPAPSRDSVPTPAVTPGTPGTPWSVETAKTLYNIENWGDGFFDISEKGHVVVRPDKSQPHRVLDLFELAHDLEAQGVGLPVLLRFSDILKARIEMLHQRFSNAIAEFQYEG